MVQNCCLIYSKYRMTLDLFRFKFGYKAVCPWIIEI